METKFSIFAPHTEALALLKEKKPVAMDVFKGMLPELRARAFAITGVTGAGTLQRCRDAIAGLAEGQTWDDSKASLIDELEPFLGEAGAETRSTLLLRTHGFQAFNASVWRTAQEDDDTTHLQYLATEDDHVRDSHMALNGITLPKSDPFWLTHTPPWEWGCRCSVRPMNQDDIEDERSSDNERIPENRNMIDGPALRKLREGALIRNGQAFNVSPPEGENALRWKPDDLRVPLTELKKRYDPDTWDNFVAWAKFAMIDSKTSVYNWLQGVDV